MFHLGFPPFLGRDVSFQPLFSWRWRMENYISFLVVGQTTCLACLQTSYHYISTIVFIWRNIKGEGMEYFHLGFPPLLGSKVSFQPF